MAKIGPSSDPKVLFEQALNTYAMMLSNLTSSNDLSNFAEKTVELSRLAQSVMHTASEKIRKEAGDFERLLETPPATDEVSILTASQHYLQNPETAELKHLIQDVYGKNKYAVDALRGEISLLSHSIKNQI